MKKDPSIKVGVVGYQKPKSRDPDTKQMERVSFTRNN